MENGILAMVLPYDNVPCHPTCVPTFGTQSKRCNGIYYPMRLLGLVGLHLTMFKDLQNLLEEERHAIFLDAVFTSIKYIPREIAKMWGTIL